MDSLVNVLRTVEATGHYDYHNDAWLGMRTVSDLGVPNTRNMLRVLFWTFRHFCPGMLHASAASANWAQLVRFAQSPAAAREAFDAAERARLAALKAAAIVPPAGFSLAGDLTKW